MKRCLGPDGTETFVLVRRQERQVKEQAIHARFGRRIRAGLTKLARIKGVDVLLPTSTGQTLQWKTLPEGARRSLTR